MAAKVAKGSIRKSKPVASKTSLSSPYEKVWRPVVGEDMHFILQTLVEKCEELGLKKIRTKRRKGKKSKNAKVTDGNDNNTATEEKSPEAETPKEEEEEAPKSRWSHTDLRKLLAIGINEVTRALEKNTLSLVIVCKSAKPELITRHIIELSYSRGVPACQLPRLSESLAPALGLNSLLALGFRKDSDVFQEQVEAIVPRVPPLHVPWLQGMCREEEEEEDGAATTPSRKRQLSPDSQPGDLKLQELRIKRIVPNPNKKRKVKVKKTQGQKKGTSAQK
ncbi:ribonuclease P protein subunit p38 [Dendropsophus ebraccatus]|uniref:ribonuclease P protein subunit p38 n=1 Tax=Dendropsophus ebraccatus TaxID=150705 RepID=UPI0038310ACE